MALSGYLWPRRAHNIMLYRSERDKPYLPINPSVLLFANRYEKKLAFLSHEG